MNTKRAPGCKRSRLLAIIFLLTALTTFAGKTVSAAANAADIDSLNRQLVAAGRASDLAAVKILLNEGANPNAIDDGYTSLDGASAFGNFTLCSYLLHRGADPNLTGTDRPIPLTLAIESGNLEVVKLLLRSGARIDNASTDGETALMRSVINANHAAITLLLDRGANVNLSNSEGQSPLFMAAYVGDAAVIKQLIAAGAKIDAATTDNYTALNVAAERGHSGAVRALLTSGAMVNDFPKHGDSTLSAAVRSGDLATFNALLTAGAALDNPDEYGNTPLIIGANLATSPRRLEILKELVDHGATVGAANGNSQTPLMAAAAAESPGAVRYLLDHGAHASAKDTFNQTALMYAAAGRRSTIMLYRRPLYSDPSPGGELAVQAQRDTAAALLAKTPELSQTAPAIFIASSNGNLGIVDALLKFGLAPDLVRDDVWYPLMSPVSRIQDAVDQSLSGMTPTMFAACHDHANIIELFASNKANLDATDDAGRTALMHAANSGSLSAVQILVKLGANVNAHDKDGRTALLDVVQCGAAGTLAKRTQGQADDASVQSANKLDEDIVAALLSAHADPTLATTDGDTAIKEATALGRSEIVSALSRKD